MNSQRGFTLIEVVVAFAILSLAVTVLFEVNQQTMRAQDSSDLERRALLHAERLLAEVGVTSRLTDRSETVHLDADFDAETTIRRRADPPNEPHYTLPAFDVSVRVLPRHSMPAHAVSLTTVKLDLEPADTGGSRG